MELSFGLLVMRALDPMRGFHPVTDSDVILGSTVAKVIGQIIGIFGGRDVRMGFGLLFIRTLDSIVGTHLVID